MDVSTVTHRRERKEKLGLMTVRPAHVTMVRLGNHFAFTLPILLPQIILTLSSVWSRKTVILGLENVHKN